MKKLDGALLQQTLYHRLADDMENARVSAAQVLVLQDGMEVASLCEGCLDWGKQQPLPENAMYRLASMTKPVTAVAALIAEDKGYFDLNDTLETHLPAFADMYVAKMEAGRVVPGEKSKTSLRLYQLLSHCNGMMASTVIGEQLVNEIPKSAYKTLETMVDYAARQPLAFEPGTFTAYTGAVSFDVLARIIEIKSGMPYAEFIQRNIFEPLGVKDFTYCPTDEQWGRLVALTDQVRGREFATIDLGRHTFEGYPLTYTGAGAGLTASIGDYAVFAEMLRNGGNHNGVQIFRPERIKELTHPYVGPEVPGRDPVSSWGLGVRVVDREGVLPVGSYGWSGAYGTHFWIDPVNHITAIYMRGSRWFDSHGGGNIGAQFEKDVMSCLEG